MKKISNYLLITAFCLLLSSFDSKAQDVKADTSLTGLYNVIKSLSNAKRMEELAMVVMKKSGGNDASIQNQCAKYVVVAYAYEGNLTKSIQWMEKITDAGVKKLALNSAMKEFFEKDKIDMAEQFLNSATVTAMKLDPNQLNMFMGEIFLCKKKYTETAKILRPVYEQTGKGAEMYAIALMKSENTSSITVMEVNKILKGLQFFSDNIRTAAKDFYIKQLGSEKRFMQIVDSVDAIQHAKVKLEVAKMATNQPAPEFQLSNLEGKTVSLSSLRGKTVFIDFWSTWCGPCVGSFPGMQKAVNYYKNDSSVVFLFVHSYERIPNAAQEVKKYISDKKYTFDVYMDLNSPVAKSFKVTNLPTKLIIDKNGIVKVRSVGFLAENEAIEEVREMIALSRKE